MSTPDSWDLSGAVIADEHAEIALIEVIRRMGARAVEFGFRWDPAWGPDPGPQADAPAGIPVTWYATVSFPMATTSSEVVAEPGACHREAMLRALAEVIRSRGGVVELVHR